MERNEYLKIAIKLSGQPARKIAEQVGVPPQQLAGWASGLRNPGDKYIPALAEALDVDEAWVAGYPGSLDIDVYAGKKATRMHILKTVHIEGYGTLFCSYSLEEELILSFILTTDGLQFFTDRISDSQPRTREEIDDVGWVSPQGLVVAKLEGLPRLVM